MSFESTGKKLLCCSLAFEKVHYLDFLKVSKFIDVDFNELDIRLSPPSWVKVLDFFGISTASTTVFEVTTPAYPSASVPPTSFPLHRDASGVDLKRNPTQESVLGVNSATSLAGGVEPRELFRGTCGGVQRF